MHRKGGPLISRGLQYLKYLRCPECRAAQGGTHCLALPATRPTLDGWCSARCFEDTGPEDLALHPFTAGTWSPCEQHRCACSRIPDATDPPGALQCSTGMPRGLRPSWWWEASSAHKPALPLRGSLCVMDLGFPRKVPHLPKAALPGLRTMTRKSHACFKGFLCPVLSYKNE